MTNREMAESYLAQAGEIIIEARGAFDRGVWNMVIRRSQEVVELVLKAALRLAGIEVPHIRDCATGYPSLGFVNTFGRIHFRPSR